MEIKRRHAIVIRHQIGAVVARLTVVRQDGNRTIVEIREDATFSAFYHFYRQQGARRSTKTLIRIANRNEWLPAINPQMYRPGLEVIVRRLQAYAAQNNPVTRITLRIIKKRAYKRLIGMPPGILKLAKNRGGPEAEHSLPLRIPVQLTSIKLGVGSVPQTGRNGF